MYKIYLILTLCSVINFSIYTLCLIRGDLRTQKVVFNYEPNFYYSLINT